MERRETHRVLVGRTTPRKRKQNPSRRPVIASMRTASACSQYFKCLYSSLSLRMTGENLPRNLPVINQPEEVVLARLQYSHGNDKWVNRASDENSNQLHILIKPMLDQL